ncbi:hypothetical protein BG004_003989 [Podila humilis]|nr:hypothetical protein BG004_003989 [Podila humilis]
MTPSSVRNASANPDFNPEEFRIQLLRQFTDMLETDLDRHLTHLASASSMSISSNNNNGSNGHVDTRSDRSSTYSSVSHGSDTSTATATTTALKKELRRVTAECVRITEKNQKLMDDNHKLEMKNLDTCHQLSRLQSNVANNNRFFMARGGNDPRSSSCLGSTTDGYNGGGEPLEWDGSTTSASSSTQVQQLMHKVSVLTSERDTLKIRVWELEKKPFDQQFAIRSTDYVDLEHERNRLVEELGIKTVAMEELWNRNEGLMIRAKEYENRVWELETQCSSLEAECASLPTIHADLSDLQARAVKADALAHKLQGLESQQTMVKTLQARVQELETSNAELDHSNWDLSERLNIANNQHALLTKEFESFRSKDKDDRRLEFLANRNRELESLLQEQVKTTTSCHKEDCDRLTIDYEKAKLRLLQLEGQAKQVSLFRTKTQQLEKQIKTMEQLEPRLDEMQHLYERNLFLEGELGELELLRARELELEGELRESKARLVQLASVNVNVSVNGNGQAASFVDVDKKTTQPLAGVQLAPGSDAECQTNPLSHVDQKDGLNANGSVVDTLREDFWSLPESAQDVFLLVGPQDIRRFRDEAGENLETLVDKTLAHLFRLVESPLFLTPHAPAQQVLNCIRILTRIFPFIFESPEKVDWEEKYFWTAQTIVVSGKRPNTSPEAERTTSKSNEQDAIQAKGVTQKDSITSHKEELLDLEEVITSNGQRLIETLQNLLFTSGFTLPTALDTTNRVSFVIWETGIGSSKPLGTTKELDDNRAEILRLLLVLFSKSIYVPPVAISATENKWIEALVTSNDRPATLATLCSLINSALKYNPSGWGLPYNHVMFGDQRDLLVMLSLQVVIVLLDYQANSVYLPGSTKVVKYHHETLILCWKTLELNKRFRAYLIETNRVLDILVILLYFCMEYKQDTTQLGLIRMCAYMLQTLSKDKTLSKSLNTTFDGHASLPNNIKIPNFHGTYGDYLICTVHNLVSTTKRTLRGSYLPLISTLANVSPYLKNISVLASSRLIQLCSLFASPSFLLSDESNHVLLSSLLDAVCSILYYQAADNPNLVYTLVQHETRIRSMANFTLQKGLTDIQRTRNHQLAQQELHTGNPSSSPTTTHHQHQQRGNNGRARRTSSSSQQQQQQQQKQYSRSSESSEKDVPQQSPNTGRRREISSSMGPLSPTDLSLSDGPLTSTGSSADIRNDDPVSNGSDNNRTDRKSSGIERDGDTKVKDNPSTASNSQPITTMSEKARGKLPERQSRTTRQAQQELEALHSSSLATEEPVSQNPKRGDNNVKSPPSSSRSKHDSNSLFADTSLQQANALFAADVGQNGFVPTEVWVRAIYFKCVGFHDGI